MKLSFAWLWDHLGADSKNFSVYDVVEQLKQKTAEIDLVEPYTIDLKHFCLARVVAVHSDSVTVHSYEWMGDFELPLRPELSIGEWYLVNREVTGDPVSSVRWSLLQDIVGGKDGYLPMLGCESVAVAAGAWKQHVETSDYLLHIDNKSITHRPDLWSHRGFAREVAALFDLPLIAQEQLLAPVAVRMFDSAVSATTESPVAVAVTDTQLCKRFSTLYVDSVTVAPSVWWMAHRLMRVDAKPINTVVDATNYVMFDIGQPMHAFDAATLMHKTVSPCAAQDRQQLTMLDGKTITLTAEDSIISADGVPLALAGVMGGRETGVTLATKQLFIEAACFDAAKIRRSAVRHKLRTEASARFEKTLNPEHTTVALRRFIALLDTLQVKHQTASAITSVGVVAQPVVIMMSHKHLESALGICLESTLVAALLRKLAFQVIINEDQTYTVTVPTFRASKDILGPEDLIEEVGRLIGYETIVPVLPRVATAPIDMRSLHRLRRIKQHCAYALHMRELYNYAFYDEQFLQQVAFSPKEAVEVSNPISEHWRRLVTSLLPHLAKAVALNSPDYDMLRFFEVGRVWHEYKLEIQERTIMSGIVYDKKGAVDFYTLKDELLSLLRVAGIYDVQWKRIDTPEQPWFAPYQTADLMYGGIVLGRAGVMHEPWLRTFAQGTAWAFELDAIYLISHDSRAKVYEPLSKYPDVVRDISIMLGVTYTADQIAALIKQADPLIVQVALLDFFHKEEWLDRKSLTFRYIMRGSTKTLTKQEIDTVVMHVERALGAVGAELR